MDCSFQNEIFLLFVCLNPNCMLHAYNERHRNNCHEFIERISGNNKLLCERSIHVTWLKLFEKSWSVQRKLIWNLLKNFFKLKKYFKLRIETFQKRGSKFVPIFKIPSINWCAFNDGKIKLMNFQKLIVSGIRKSAPRFFHKCVKNLILRKSFFKN